MRKLLVPLLLPLLAIPSLPNSTRAQAGLSGPPRFSPATPLRWELPAPPDPLWTARFGAFDNQWPYAGDDIPSTILTDAAGNAVVTGEGGFPPGSVDLNFMTIKYDSLGDTLWVRSFDNPLHSQSNDQAAEMAIGASGKVFVAGTLNYNTGWTDTHDIGVVAYDDSGGELWWDTYSGPYDYMATATSAARDDSGHLYAGGQFSEAYAWHAGLVQYDTLGTRNWVVSEGSDQNRIFYDIACDETGHVYGAGEGWGGQLKGCLIRYDAGGNKLWENHYNPRWQGASFSHLALDPDGNACVTGWRESPVSGDNNLAWITIEYGPAGNELWEQTFNRDTTSQSSDQEIPSGIAVGPAGNVYVTGNSASMITTVKYSHQGNAVWVRQYPGGNGLGMGPNAITVDSHGSIYVAGGSAGDYVVIKYRSTGDELWALTWDSGGGVSDYATGVATWGSRLFVTGTAGYPMNGYRDYLTIRYQ